jgi:hypothetical protein
MTVVQQYADLRRQAIIARLAGKVQDALAFESRAEDLHDYHATVTLDLVEKWDEAAASGEIPLGD